MSICNIKSIYFVEKIFLYLDDLTKLKLVTYNKSLQNILKVNIINYKLLSGKYIEYESNDKKKGKEYNCYNDKLIFNGEYHNGKKNGKGKEYNKFGYLIFEGEYLNGKRNGKGKEYIDEYSILFEGEYLDGKRWNGKGCDKYGNIINELKEGKGFIREFGFSEEYGETVFEGEYSNGEKNGKGTLYNGYSTKIFDGEFLNGKTWTGKGYDADSNVVLELKDGKGFMKKFNEEKILIIDSEYLNGELNGKTKLYNGEGKLVFEGEYRTGKKTGKIKEYDYKGKLKFDGEYLYGHKRNGKVYNNGILEFEGELLFDRKWSGKGYDEKGNIIYELNNGNGKVKEYLNGKLIFEGEYLNGKKKWKRKRI